MEGVENHGFCDGPDVSAFGVPYRAAVPGVRHRRVVASGGFTGQATEDGGMLGQDPLAGFLAIDALPWTSKSWEFYGIVPKLPNPA